MYRELSTGFIISDFGECVYAGIPISASFIASTKSAGGSGLSADSPDWITNSPAGVK